MNAIALLCRFIAVHDAVVALTGAGVSTASGIPDYRDENGAPKGTRPIQFGEFMRSRAARRRYWARSYAGWRRFSAALPNAAHRALAVLESCGKIDTLITQNVDRLHRRAGSRSVIDLHGDLNQVRCMDCDATYPRNEHQRRMHAANPAWHAEVMMQRPDGDVELADDAHERFTVPDCRACGGTLKPDVVMFGENVPKARVRDAFAAVERADALLVVGSSLTVFSGYRFARQAHALGIPIAIVNRGRTRADELATIKVEDDCVRVLPRAIHGLANGHGGSGSLSGKKHSGYVIPTPRDKSISASRPRFSG